MNSTGHKPLLKYLICLCLAVVTFAAFSGVLNCSFVSLDDRVYVVANPSVKHGLSWQAVKWACEAIYAGYWIPVTWLSHMLDCQIYGLNPAGHHLTNLIFHVADMVLLFLLLEKLTARLWPSAFVALLFGIHPMHVESVAWIAERKDVLSAFFFFLTLLAYARYAPGKAGEKSLSPPGRSKGGASVLRFAASPFYWLALLFFTLGLMSKPMIVTLPFILLLLDFWPIRRLDLQSPGRLLIEKIPFFLLSAFFCYITFLAASGVGAVRPEIGLSVLDRLAHVFISYGWYLAKFFWPVNLSVFYPLRPQTFGPEALSAGLLLFIVTVLALLSARKRPWLFCGWLWFLGMLVPVIGLVQAGDQAYADRFSYLPYVGLSMVIAWGIPDLLTPSRFAVSAATRNCILVAGAATVAIACFVRTVQEVGYWKNGLILFDRALVFDPKNAEALMAIGAEYSNRGNYAKAMDCMTRATVLAPHLGMAWHDLGKLLAHKGNFAAAESAYQTALEWTRFQGDRMEIFNDLGDSYASAGAFSQAISAYQSSLELNHSQPDTDTKLGQALMQNQEPDQAAPAFRAALELQPGDADAEVGLGMIAQSSGFDSAAAADYRQAVAIDPDSLLALNNLAWLLATDPDPALRNGPEAVSLAEHACQLTHYQKPFLIGTLAAAYAEAGRFDDAVATAQKAHDLAQADGDKDIAARNLQLMALYKSRRPYHADHPK